MSKINLFISYSHEDKEYKEKLLKHLAPIEKHEYLSPWHDSMIDAGDEWQNSINDALENSDIILLLISASFINSKFCYEIELKTALKRHAEGNAIIIPIILRSCLWQETSFANLQAIPTKSVDSFQNEDDAYTEIAKSINKEVQFQYHIKLGDEYHKKKDIENAKKQYGLAEKIKINNIVTKRLERIGKQVNGKLEIDELHKKEQLVTDINDARFIKDGFIGLQKQINILESSQNIGKGYERLAVLGHLPSFMRLNPLTEEIGRILYYNWEPEYYIPDYVDLVNQRADFFKSYIDSGGISRDIFFKNSISKYVQNRFTFHDKNEDPLEEIEERINTLIHYNKKKNYFLYLLEEEKTVPKFLLKTKIGLVVDLRTTEVNKHFTHSIDGLFTQSDEIIKEFSRKFSNMIDNLNYNRVLYNEEFLNKLLNEIKSYKNEK